MAGDLLPLVRGMHGGMWSAIGQSRQGRDIEATRVGTGPLRVYLVGGIHGDEPEGRGSIDCLVEALAEGSIAEMASVRIVRDANPDGSEALTRGNALDRDLNRNWPASNFSVRSGNGERPLSEPETAAIHADMELFDPRVVIVFHSARAGPFVNFDGPAGELAGAFVEAASRSESRWHLVPEMGYGTPGSLGSYVGVDGGIPILTIEFRRGQKAELVLAAAVEGVQAVIRRAAIAN
ncbi:MAG: succinylglutamate desuccinylase/aspartoacylase family protein [Phycisphaerales bacterium]|nr:succinylglutamate desuccinylase/aspartoacylase family protein [Phycisphaerales bacterium]